MATADSNSLIRCHDIMERLGITKTQATKMNEVVRNARINCTAFFRKLTGENIDIVVAGSQGEGTAVISLDSDVDLLFIQRSVKCFKSSPSTNESKNYLVTCLLDFENVKNGYAMLRVMSVGHTRTEGRLVRNINDGIIQDDNGHRYLRNDIIFTNCLDNKGQGICKKPFAFSDITGPANTFEIPFFRVSVDLVQAFPMSYSGILDRWRKRERKYAWPSNDVIERALRQDVFVVPVGVYGRDEEVRQWRLSVTLAEQTLIQSFNDTQIKLFVAVKMIVKHELKPIYDRMSSYLVKNVIFWVFEGTKECLFRREYFDELLLDILKRLRRSIYWKYQQNYMLPYINMLDKIFETERRKLVQRLDDIIANGCSSALLKCPLARNLSQDNLVNRQVMSQFFLAVFCIPKSYFEQILKDFIIDEKFDLDIKQCDKTFFTRVLPIIRETNPFDFFDILVTMSEEEIRYRLYTFAFTDCDSLLFREGTS